MERKFVWFLLVALLVLASAVAIPATAMAEKPQEFTAYGGAYVVSGGVVQPAGASGRFVTTMEVVQTSALGSAWDLINGGALTVLHNSNTKLILDESGNLISVENGRAHGKFTLTTATGDTYQGSYNSEISTTSDCTIYDAGHWTLNSGQARGNGTLSVCLNFVPALGTFVGPALMEGQHN